MSWWFHQRTCKCYKWFDEGRGHNLVIQLKCISGLYGFNYENIKETSNSSQQSVEAEEREREHIRTFLTYCKMRGHQAE